MIGIDKPIENLRLLFESNLWEGKENSFNGRCFRNIRDDKLIPEIKVGKNDYREVLLQDVNHSTVFFDVPNDRTVIGSSDITTDVSIYFSINLEKLYPTLDRNEATETAYKDVIRYVNASSFDFTGISTGFDSFDTWGYDNVDFDNMYPYHLFRVDTKLIYNLNC
jgi:hypothetical protein